MPTTSRKVFLSYAREDGLPFARDLSARLSAAGHQPWRDEERLTALAGVRWVAELTRQLLTADVVVVILTPGAYKSRYVEGEWTKAMSRRLPVVPTMFVDSGVPLPLEPLQYIDFRTDFQTAFGALLERLDGMGVSAERDRQMLEALRALRANATGAEAAELDALVGDLAERINSYPADVRAQSDRVERGIAEARARAEAEAVQPSGPGVRRYGRPPLTALDSFHDRQQQQVEIASALLDPKVRMVSVLGRGGMGKTALACYVLAQLEARQTRSSGDAARLRGITYVQHTPTHPVTLDRVLLSIAHVLPDEERAKAERLFSTRDLATEDRIDRFLELVTAGTIVVLLDNFEDLLDERGRIRDADLNLFVRRVLTGPGVLRLLITARAAITLPPVELRAEHQVVIRDGLPPEDALMLLKELDPNRQLGLGDADDGKLLKLVQLTHGIPRALELVANILQGEDGTFVFDLDDVATNFYTRETVVQQLVEANYAKLRLEARRVLEALAVFGRPVPPVGIDFMLQPHVPGLRLSEVLQPLVNARLVSVDRGGDGRSATLGLHPIDRDFLYQRLPMEGAYSRATLHTRAAEFYRTQRAHGPIGWRDLAQLLPQLLEYEHLVQAGAYDDAAILLGEYGPAITYCGHPSPCRDLYLKLPERFTSDVARINYALTCLSWKAFLGPIADGLKAGEEALRMAVAIGDARLELRARAELVTAYRYAHDAARSTLHAEKIIECIRESPGDAASDAANTYHAAAFDLVLGYTYAGDVRRAAPLAWRLYEAARETNDPRSLATALNGLLVLYFAWGRYADAVQLTAEIERVWQPGFHDGIAYCRNLIGMSLYLLGDYAGSVSMMADARKAATEWDSPRPEALSLWNVSLIHALHGVYDKAIDSGRDAEVLMTRLGLDRAADAPRKAAEAAVAKDYATVVRNLLRAAEESTTCGDMFPGPVLAERADQIAQGDKLPDLGAEARAVRERLGARLQLPDSEEAPA